MKGKFSRFLECWKCYITYVTQDEKIGLMCTQNLTTFYTRRAPAAGQHVPGFLKLNLCRLSVCVCVFVCLHVCVCVCLPLRLLITSGVMWRDIDPIGLVKQVL